MESAVKVFISPRQITRLELYSLLLLAAAGERPIWNNHHHRTHAPAQKFGRPPAGRWRAPLFNCLDNRETHDSGGGQLNNL